MNWMCDGLLVPALPADEEAWDANAHQAPSHRCAPFAAVCCPWHSWSGTLPCNLRYKPHLVLPRHDGALRQPPPPRPVVVLLIVQHHRQLHLRAARETSHGARCMQQSPRCSCLDLAELSSVTESSQAAALLLTCCMACAEGNGNWELTSYLFLRSLLRHRAVWHMVLVVVVPTRCRSRHVHIYQRT